jgi:hypothetical protein
MEARRADVMEAMQYEHLDAASRRAILLQRMTQLEAKHFEIALNLQTWEAQQASDPEFVADAPVEQWRNELQSLEIALAVHRSALGELPQTGDRASPESDG